jgi:hypothetical protein
MCAAIVVAGAVLAALVVIASMSAGSPAARGATASAPRRALGSVTAVAWSVRTPVRARMVLRPFVTVKVEKRALRLLRARKPLVSARFVARIVTRPRRGRSRTLAVVSRRLRSHRIRASSARRHLGRPLPLRRIVLTRRQTARVKRAAGRQRLAIVAGVRWRARYTDAHGRRVATPTRPAATLLALALTPPRARGARLRSAAISLRRVMARLRRARIACLTRDTMMRRLRATYGTLVSGDRTGAADLLRVWIADVTVKASAGVVLHPDASRLQSGLRGVLARVGSGRSKPLRHAPRLPRPPRCGSRPVPPPTLVASSALKIASYAFTAIYGGTPVRRLKKMLWPDGPTLECAWDTNLNQDTCSSASIYDLIEEDAINFAGAKLNELSKSMDTFFSAEDHASSNPASAISTYWDAVNAFVTNGESTFQRKGYEKPLLPLFAQYENLYLSLLRHGVLDGPKFGLVEEDIRDIEDMIQDEVRGRTVESCPNRPCPPRAYITYWFQKAVHDDAAHYDNNEKQYESKNSEWLDKQLKALDFRDLWPLQDPLTYPYGDPNFRQKRMIYSDEWGRTDSTFPEFGLNDATGELTNPPFPNVDHPLSHVTAWTKKVYWVGIEPVPRCYTWLDAIKLDNAPVEGSITGDTGLTEDDPACYEDHSARPPTPSGHDVASGNTPPPISEVTASYNQRNLVTSPQHLVETVKFTFADGGWWVPGGSFVEYPGALGWPDCAGPPGPEEAAKTCTWAFPDEVLAGAKIMDRDIWSGAHNVADAIVFGFRFEDSFAPPPPQPLFGKVTAPSPNDQKCMAVEQKALQGDTPDYAHQGEQTGYRHVRIGDGKYRFPQVQMYDCDYGGWKHAATDTTAASDTTAWETTWSFNKQGSYPGGAAGDGQLTVFGGSQCAAPDPADTTPPIAVQAQDCDESNLLQLWKPPSSTTGIVHSGSGLCLERSGLSNGSRLQLNTCDLSDAQKWSWPAGWNAPSATDTTPPAVSVAAAPSQKASRTIKLALRATSERMRATVSGRLAIRGSKKTYRLKGVGNRLIERGRKATLRLRVSKKTLRAARRALRGHRRVTARLVIEVRDGAWNVSTTVRTIRLRA